MLPPSNPYRRKGRLATRVKPQPMAYASNGVKKTKVCPVQNMMRAKLKRGVLKTHK